MADIGILAAVVLAYALVSGRLKGTVVTAPMVFVLAGLALGPAGIGAVSFDLESEVVLAIAEITLVVLLFTDASRIDLAVLRRNKAMPTRLLVIGLPLTIIAGLALGLALLPGLEFWEAAILAAVLAPTDAALGQAVVENKAIPQRIRQALNVESGLNDGLSVPFLTVFIALAEREEGLDAPSFFIRFTLEQIVYGAFVGVAVGALGGMLIARAKRAGAVSGAVRAARGGVAADHRVGGRRCGRWERLHRRLRRRAGRGCDARGGTPGGRRTSRSTRVSCSTWRRSSSSARRSSGRCSGTSTGASRSMPSRA